MKANVAELKANVDETKDNINGVRSNIVDNDVTSSVVELKASVDEMKDNIYGVRRNIADMKNVMDRWTYYEDECEAIFGLAGVDEQSSSEL